MRLGTQETMAYKTFAMDANGRTEYKPQMWRLTQTKGDSNGQGDRAGNSVKYITPVFAGFTGHALAGLGESSSLGNQSLAIKYQDEKTKAGSLTTHTVGIKVPVDQITFALSCHKATLGWRFFLFGSVPCGQYRCFHLRRGEIKHKTNTLIV